LRLIDRLIGYRTTGEFGPLLYLRRERGASFAFVGAREK
jgi:hypothetical protein